MKYIIIVDNDKTNCSLLKDLLISYKEKNNFKNVKIGSWYNLSNNINESADKFCEAIQEYCGDKENSIVLLIDLLLTFEEEEHVSSIADGLISSDKNNSPPASGITFATNVINHFNNSKQIKVSFMSKWLNLQSGIDIEKYNGIHNEAVWKGRKPKSFLNPINANHHIINRELSVPMYGAKTIVDVLFKIAFED